MASAPKTDSASNRHSLFDRYREAGVAGRLVAELTVRAKEQKRARRRKIVKLTTGAAVFVATLLWGVPYFKDTATHAVPAATQSSLALADGSQVELNANSVLHSDFRYGRRQVRLERGEAFFSVTGSPTRPFEVRTPAGVVRVLGTKFNVRLQEGASPIVTLIEGAVAFESLGRSEAMRPGEQLTFSDRRFAIERLPPEKLERDLAWRSGKIILDGVPLSEAAELFANYHQCRIKVDPAVAAVRLGGTYALKNLPLFLDSLKTTGAIGVISSSDGSLRLTGP